MQEIQFQENIGMFTRQPRRMSTIKVYFYLASTIEFNQAKVNLIEIRFFILFTFRSMHVQVTFPLVIVPLAILNITFRSATKLLHDPKVIRFAPRVMKVCSYLRSSRITNCYLSMMCEQYRLSHRTCQANPSHVHSRLAFPGMKCL